MFKTIDDVPTGVVAVTALGVIHAQDYETVLIPKIQAALEHTDKVSVLLHFGPEFGGYAFGAVWEDMVFGVSHWRAFRKIAVVSDVDWIRHAVGLFAPILPAQVKVFPNKALHAAKDWITA